MDVRCSANAASQREVHAIFSRKFTCSLPSIWVRRCKYVWAIVSKTETAERGAITMRWGRAALIALLVVAVAAATLTYARTHASALTKPKVVLDPDDNLSHGLHDGTTYDELPITYDIAQKVQA